MYTGSIDYTVCSTDPSRYSRINCNLTAPVTRFSAMTVTCLTANCNIMVLSKDDYLTINDVKITLDQDYSNLNGNTLARVLNDLLDPVINVVVDSANRLVFGSSQEFVINDMSYNTKLITGFYNTSLPIKSHYNEAYDSRSEDLKIESVDNQLMKYLINAESVGFMLSTPILYLVSNVGMQSYRNIKSMNDDDKRDPSGSGKPDDLCGAKIVMRLNNSFSANYPITVNNADFTTTLCSNDLSSLEFRLVDAYMHEIKLLSPMYLSITVRAVEEEMIPSSFELMYSRRELSEANGINR